MKELHKKDMIVDLVNGTIDIPQIGLIDIDVIYDAYERIQQRKGIEAAQEQGVHMGRPIKDVPDDFIHYYNFKEQLQMKNGFTLVDLRRQKKIWDFLVTPVWEETETGNSVKASVNQKLFHLTNPL